ncbi:hypothetical protein BPOR_0858g00040 [Botrytis porri]|uniref:PAS-like domain-containing protein n=1 Tax=Botrytis porri TaxID=87229 RepID=A0A4Z1KAA0_9HELO|nr:hypothetical protein BPOR_0858g00040 [Botrytis porri]
MNSEAKSIFAPRFEENCQQHQQHQHRHRHQHLLQQGEGNKVSRCTITIHQCPVPILPILEPTLAQTSCGAHGYASGLDRTKRQGSISTHGTEELDARESTQFTSTNNNNSPSQLLNFDIPISVSSQKSNSWLASVSSNRDRDRDHDPDPDLQGIDNPESQRRVSTASSTTLLSTPQLSPLSPSLQASKHSREEDNVPERTFDITISEPPFKRHRAKLKHCHILQADNEAAHDCPTTLQSPRSPRFTTHKLKRTHSSQSSPNIDTTVMSKLDKDGNGITILKSVRLARGNILGNNSNPPGKFIGPTLNLEQQRRTASPKLSADPQEGSLIHKVGIIELLEQDERPTFIIDVSNQENYIPGGRLRLEYANASLRAMNPLLEMIAGFADLSSPTIVTHAFPEFKAWVLSFVSKESESLDICLPSFLYGGFTWRCSTLQKRLRVMNGVRTLIPTTNSTSSNANNSSPTILNPGFVIGQDLRSSTDLFPEPSDYFGDAATVVPGSSPIDSLLAGNQVAHIDGSSFDWTRLPLTAALPRHIQFTRNINWAASPLGPMKNWSFDLRAMCNLIMGSPHPAAMYWGSEYTAIYNEAYILLAGQKHPSLMGQSYKTAWAEIWDDIEAVFAKAKSSGQATMKDEDRLFIKRNGYLEECYFAWSIIPLVGEDGSVVGLYNPTWEKTRRVISERRMLTLREVGEKTATARNIKGFWAQVIKALEYNPFDIPFALLYSVNEDVDSDMSSQRSLNSGSMSQAPCCVLEGTIGVPQGHQSAATPLDLHLSEDGFAPYLRECMRLDRPVLLTTEEGTLPTELIRELECEGFGDPCRAAVAIPLHATSRESILGFLVM